MQPVARPAEPVPSAAGARSENQRPWALRLLLPAKEARSENAPELATGKEDGLLAFAPEHETPPPNPEQNRSKRLMLVSLLAALSVTGAALLGLYLQGRFGTAVSAEPAALTVHSNPVGAEVLLGGQKRGVTPLKLSVPPGAYRLEVRSGEASRVLPIEVRSGSDATHYIDLPTSQLVTAGTGALQISTEPAGAAVAIDGTPAGSTPLMLANVAAGEHQITLASGGMRLRRTVRVQPGATASLVASMSAADALGGWLSVVSSLPLHVFADGALVGTSDSLRMMLPVGSHKIAVENAASGFRNTYAVAISAGKTSKLTIELPRGLLHINALPWAEVWIDGKSVGETPIAGLSLPIGPHNVVFRHPQLGERRTTATVIVNGPTRVGVDMHK
jgi:hypothetical protein